MRASRAAIVVVDLAFGDCGKGTVVDFLARRHDAHTVVRFNGGPQAAHNVITPEGYHHAFAQLGSGSFVPGVRTLLSRFVFIEPYALFNEAAHLRQLGVDALPRLAIDAACPVITPAHQAANRLQEMARGAAAHGTCGMGVGQAAWDLIHYPAEMLHAKDLAQRAVVRKKLREVLDRKAHEVRDAVAGLHDHPGARSSVEVLQDPSWIETAVDVYSALASNARIASAAEVSGLMRQSGMILFEGAQGVLLDECYGFHPHTTWSNTTPANAITLLREAGTDHRPTVMGVLRTYFTRHGRGPLVTEDRRLLTKLTEKHNNDESWQGPFRVGIFDAVAARYARDASGQVDALALTHLDCADRLPPCLCTAYQMEEPSSAWDGELQARLDWRDGRIANLRVPSSVNVGQQEQLTAALARCQPVYSPFPGHGAEAMQQVIQKELQTPVILTSWGPTANEKHYRDVSKHA